MLSMMGRLDLPVDHPAIGESSMQLLDEEKAVRQVILLAYEEAGTVPSTNLFYGYDLSIVHVAVQL